MYKEVLMPSLKNSSIYIHEIKDTPRDVFYGLHIHDECEMARVIGGNGIFFSHLFYPRVQDVQPLFARKIQKDKTSEGRGRFDTRRE